MSKKKNNLKTEAYIVDDNEVYIMEKITKHRYKREIKEFEFHVKWLGYSTQENTWEPLSFIVEPEKNEVLLSYLDSISMTFDLLILSTPISSKKKVTKTPIKEKTNVVSEINPSTSVIPINNPLALNSFFSTFNNYTELDVLLAFKKLKILTTCSTPWFQNIYNRHVLSLPSFIPDCVSETIIEQLLPHMCQGLLFSYIMSDPSNAYELSDCLINSISKFEVTQEFYEQILSISPLIKGYLKAMSERDFLPHDIHTSFLKGILPSHSHLRYLSIHGSDNSDDNVRNLFKVHNSLSNPTTLNQSSISSVSSTPTSFSYDLSYSNENCDNPLPSSYSSFPSHNTFTSNVTTWSYSNDSSDSNISNLNSTHLSPDTYSYPAYDNIPNLHGFYRFARRIVNSTPVRQHHQSHHHQLLNDLYQHDLKCHLELKSSHSSICSTTSSFPQNISFNNNAGAFRTLDHLWFDSPSSVTENQILPSSSFPLDKYTSEDDSISGSQSTTKNTNDVELKHLPISSLPYENTDECKPHNSINRDQKISKNHHPINVVNEWTAYRDQCIRMITYMLSLRNKRASGDVSRCSIDSEHLNHEVDISNTSSTSCLMSDNINSLVSLGSKSDVNGDIKDDDDLKSYLQSSSGLSSPYSNEHSSDEYNNEDIVSVFEDHRNDHVKFSSEGVLKKTSVQLCISLPTHKKPIHYYPTVLQPFSYNSASLTPTLPNMYPYMLYPFSSHHSLLAFSPSLNHILPLETYSSIIDNPIVSSLSTSAPSSLLFNLALTSIKHPVFTQQTQHKIDTLVKKTIGRIDNYITLHSDEKNRSIHRYDKDKLKVVLTDKFNHLFVSFSKLIIKSLCQSNKLPECHSIANHLDDVNESSITPTINIQDYLPEDFNTYTNSSVKSPISPPSHVEDLDTNDHDSDSYSSTMSPSLPEEPSCLPSLKSNPRLEPFINPSLALVLDSDFTRINTAIDDDPNSLSRVGVYVTQRCISKEEIDIITDLSHISPADDGLRRYFQLTEPDVKSIYYPQRSQFIGEPSFELENACLSSLRKAREMRIVKFENELERGWKIFSDKYSTLYDIKGKGPKRILSYIGPYPEPVRVFRKERREARTKLLGSNNIDSSTRKSKKSQNKSKKSNSKTNNSKTNLDDNSECEDATDIHIDSDEDYFSSPPKGNPVQWSSGESFSSEEVVDMDDTVVDTDQTEEVLNNEWYEYDAMKEDFESNLVGSDVDSESMSSIENDPISDEDNDINDDINSGNGSDVDISNDTDSDVSDSDVANRVNHLDDMDDHNHLSDILNSDSHFSLSVDLLQSPSKNPTISINLDDGNEHMLKEDSKTDLPNNINETKTPSSSIKTSVEALRGAGLDLPLPITRAYIPHTKLRSVSETLDHMQYEYEYNVFPSLTDPLLKLRYVDCPLRSEFPYALSYFTPLGHLPPNVKPKPHLSPTPSPTIANPQSSELLYGLLNYQIVVHPTQLYDTALRYIMMTGPKSSANRMPPSNNTRKQFFSSVNTSTPLNSSTSIAKNSKLEGKKNSTEMTDVIDSVEDIIVPEVKLEEEYSDTVSSFKADCETPSLLPSTISSENTFQIPPKDKMHSLQNEYLSQISTSGLVSSDSSIPLFNTFPDPATLFNSAPSYTYATNLLSELSLEADELVHAIWELFLSDSAREILNFEGYQTSVTGGWHRRYLHDDDYAEIYRDSTLESEYCEDFDPDVSNNPNLDSDCDHLDILDNDLDLMNQNSYSNSNSTNIMSPTFSNSKMKTLQKSQSTSTENRPLFIRTPHGLKSVVSVTRMLSETTQNHQQEIHNTNAVDLVIPSQRILVEIDASDNIRRVCRVDQISIDDYFEPSQNLKDFNSLLPKPSECRKRKQISSHKYTSLNRRRGSKSRLTFISPKNNSDLLVVLSSTFNSPSLLNYNKKCVSDIKVNVEFSCDHLDTEATLPTVCDIVKNVNNTTIDSDVSKPDDNQSIYNPEDTNKTTFGNETVNIIRRRSRPNRTMYQLSHTLNCSDVFDNTTDTRTARRVLRSVKRDDSRTPVKTVPDSSDFFLTEETVKNRVSDNLTNVNRSDDETPEHFSQSLFSDSESEYDLNSHSSSIKLDTSPLLLNLPRDSNSNSISTDPSLNIITSNVLCFSCGGCRGCNRCSGKTTDSTRSSVKPNLLSNLDVNSDLRNQSNTDDLNVSLFTNSLHHSVSSSSSNYTSNYHLATVINDAKLLSQKSVLIRKNRIECDIDDVLSGKVNEVLIHTNHVDHQIGHDKDTPDNGIFSKSQLGEVKDIIEVIDEHGQRRRVLKVKMKKEGLKKKNTNCKKHKKKSSKSTITSFIDSKFENSDTSNSATYENINTVNTCHTNLKACHTNLKACHTNVKTCHTNEKELDHSTDVPPCVATSSSHNKPKHATTSSRNKPKSNGWSGERHDLGIDYGMIDRCIAYNEVDEFTLSWAVDQILDGWSYSHQFDQHIHPSVDLWRYWGGDQKQKDEKTYPNSRANSSEKPSFVDVDKRPSDDMLLEAMKDIVRSQNTGNQFSLSQSSLSPSSEFNSESILLSSVQETHRCSIENVHRYTARNFARKSITELSCLTSVRERSPIECIPRSTISQLISDLNIFNKPLTPLQHIPIKLSPSPSAGLNRLIHLISHTIVTQVLKVNLVYFSEYFDYLRGDTLMQFDQTLHRWMDNGTFLRLYREKFELEFNQKKSDLDTPIDGDKETPDSKTNRSLLKIKGESYSPDHYLYSATDLIRSRLHIETSSLEVNSTTTPSNSSVDENGECLSVHRNTHRNRADPDDGMSFCLSHPSLEHIPCLPNDVNRLIPSSSGFLSSYPSLKYYPQFLPGQVYKGNNVGGGKKPKHLRPLTAFVSPHYVHLNRSQYRFENDIPPHLSDLGEEDYCSFVYPKYGLELFYSKEQKRHLNNFKSDSDVFRYIPMNSSNSVEWSRDWWLGGSSVKATVCYTTQYAQTYQKHDTELDWVDGSMDEDTHPHHNVIDLGDGIWVDANSYNAWSENRHMVQTVYNTYMSDSNFPIKLDSHTNRNRNDISNNRLSPGQSCVTDSNIFENRFGFDSHSFQPSRQFVRLSSVQDPLIHRTEQSSSIDNVFDEPASLNDYSVSPSSSSLSLVDKKTPLLDLPLISCTDEELLLAALALFDISIPNISPHLNPSSSYTVLPHYLLSLRYPYSSFDLSFTPNFVEWTQSNSVHDIVTVMRARSCYHTSPSSLLSYINNDDKSLLAFFIDRMFRLTCDVRVLYHHPTHPYLLPTHSSNDSEVEHGEDEVSDEVCVEPCNNHSSKIEVEISDSEALCDVEIVDVRVERGYDHHTDTDCTSSLGYYYLHNSGVNTLRLSSPDYSLFSDSVMVDDHLVKQNSVINGNQHILSKKVSNLYNQTSVTINGVRCRDYLSVSEGNWKESMFRYLMTSLRTPIFRHPLRQYSFTQYLTTSRDSLPSQTDLPSDYSSIPISPLNFSSDLLSSHSLSPTCITSSTSSSLSATDANLKPLIIISGVKRGTLPSTIFNALSSIVAKYHFDSFIPHYDSDSNSNTDSASGYETL